MPAALPISLGAPLAGGPEAVGPAGSVGSVLPAGVFSVGAADSSAIFGGFLPPAV